MFLSVHHWRGWYLSQVPSPFPKLWSLILSWGTSLSGLMSLLGGSKSLIPCPSWGYPSPGWAYPSTDWRVPQSWSLCTPVLGARGVPQGHDPPARMWGPPWWGQIMLQVVYLLQFPTGGLPCLLRNTRISEYYLLSCLNRFLKYIC